MTASFGTTAAWQAHVAAEYARGGRPAMVAALEHAVAEYPCLVALWTQHAAATEDGGASSAELEQVYAAAIARCGHQFYSHPLWDGWLKVAADKTLVYRQVALVPLHQAARYHEDGGDWSTVAALVAAAWEYEKALEGPETWARYAAWAGATEGMDAAAVFDRAVDVEPTMWTRYVQWAIASASPATREVCTRATAASPTLEVSQLYALWLETQGEDPEPVYRDAAAAHPTSETVVEWWLQWRERVHGDSAAVCSRLLEPSAKRQKVEGQEHGSAESRLVNPRTLAAVVVHWTTLLPVSQAHEVFSTHASRFHSSPYFWNTFYRFEQLHGLARNVVQVFDYIRHTTALPLRAVERIAQQHRVWELGHGGGRLNEPLLPPGVDAATVLAHNGTPGVPSTTRPELTRMASWDSPLLPLPPLPQFRNVERAGQVEYPR